MGDRINFDSFYRGICVDNNDPLVLGRLKIHVPGVYAEELSKDPINLPWAEPVMPLGGGSWTNELTGCLNTETGISTIPHTSSKPLEGAQLWVFFEKGDQNYPKYFGAVQSGPGWLSENNNQHVIKTDNVRIRVDEHPLSGESTCFFNTYNENCANGGNIVENKPARVDVEIWCASGIALNFFVSGDVNMHVKGDFYEEHLGNKHETLNGNLYRCHIGDVFEEHFGDTTIYQEGDILNTQKGDRALIQEGDQAEAQIGNKILVHEGDKDVFMIGNVLKNQTGKQDLKLIGDIKENLVGKKNIQQIGDKTINQIGKVINTVVGESEQVNIGDMKNVIAGTSEFLIAGLQKTTAILIQTNAGTIQEKAGVILHN
jgi:hypothetical protein